jgi:uncharacterized protein YbaR (Trm112 family)
VSLENALLKILACPIDKGALLYYDDEAILYNPRLRRRYRIADGIPVMLAQRAEPVGDDEHARLVELADAGAAARTLI